MIACSPRCEADARREAQARLWKVLDRGRRKRNREHRLETDGRSVAASGLLSVLLTGTATRGDRWTGHRPDPKGKSFYFTSINRLAALNIACERENAK